MRKLLLLSLIMSGVAFGQVEADSDAASQTILDVDLQEVVVTSGVIDVAKARQTPIAVSRISAQEVMLKVGNMEFPEVMNKTLAHTLPNKEVGMEIAVFRCVVLTRPTRPS